MQIFHASFSLLGKRENNEDFYHYFQLNANHHAFIVCDGVGGHQFGEIASQTVAHSIEEYFKSHHFSQFNDSNIRSSISYAQQKLKKTAGNYHSQNMASTLCFLAIANKTAFICWAGDSRIYYWKNQQKVFETKDHSYVNWLIEMGEISKEEAANHPKKNVITKSINPLYEPEPDIEIFSLTGNNYFLICTDGVLESIDEEKINTLWQNHQSVEEALNFIKNECEKKSTDNATATLVQVNYPTTLWSKILEKF